MQKNRLVEAVLRIPYSTTNLTMTNSPSGPYHQVVKNLKILFLGAPGYPELVFQFPEGDFTFGGMIAGKKV